jgi:hypothetical protein
MIRAALALLALQAGAQDSKEAEKIEKARSTLLRAAPKPYAAFISADPAKGEVALRLENETAEKAMPIDADAEIRVRGGWGRLEDLAKGERVWTWMRIGRDGKPRAVILIADEISEQDIHQVPYTLAAVDVAKREVVIKRKLDGKTEQSRALKAPEPPAQEGEEYAFGSTRVKLGGTVYVRTAGAELLGLVGAEGLAALKREQRERLDRRLKEEGLQGTVAALHGVVGEVEIVVDHEAMRWARSLKPKDLVKLGLEKPAAAVVVDVRPWNERTRLTLGAGGRDLADLRVGQRLRVLVPEPAAEVLASRFPPDAGRAREGAARTEWFLSSTYCSCSIAGDGCTGMFYTLAACNTMNCGMPNRVRKFVAPLLEKGLSDREVLESMEKEFGPAIWRSHLLR